MLTIKYTDRDGIEHIGEGRDIRAVRSERQVTAMSWIDESGIAATLDFPTTAYVMNGSGATIAKYVVIGPKGDEQRVEAA